MKRVGIFAIFLTACGIGAAQQPSEYADATDQDAGSDADDSDPDPGDGINVPPGPCDDSPCDSHALCSDLTGVAVCSCPSGYTGDGLSCTAVVDPCVTSGTCPDNVWIQRTLPGIGDGKVQSVLVDPVRPSDFYAFAGNNSGPIVKVYVSTDFGSTWENRNTTTAFKGNPWGASIDPNPNRDPGTHPTLWSPAGFSAQGAWKSTDGGVTWTRATGADDAFETYNAFGNTDLYHIAILPDDPPNHLFATYHYGFKDADDGGFGESWDGGETWVVHPPPQGIGQSHYVMAISGTTWAVISQDNYSDPGANGIWRTTTAGRVGGTAGAKYRDGTISTAAWEKVGTLEHVHGSHQNVVVPAGITIGGDSCSTGECIFATGANTGALSHDYGASWTKLTNGNWAGERQFEQSSMSNVAVTERYVYTNYMLSPTLARAPIGDPIGAEKWDRDYCETPAGMTDGGAPFGMVASYNSATGKWIVVAGSYAGSVWTLSEGP